MARRDYANLIGQTITLEGSGGAFRQCPTCDYRVGEITEATPTNHAARVRCKRCHSHISWLSKDHLDALKSKMVGA